MKTALINITPGQTVKYRGTPCTVFEHRPEGTLLLCNERIKKPFGRTNNFATSSLRDHLNGAFLDALTQGHPDEIITRTVDLTAVNGSKEYGSCVCKVAPLTLDEIRKYHGILPKPESFEWCATPWSTPVVDEDETWVQGLSSNGNVYDNGCNNTDGSRPAFLIASGYTVEDERNPLEQYMMRPWSMTASPRPWPSLKS